MVRVVLHGAAVEIVRFVVGRVAPIEADVRGAARVDGHGSVEVFCVDCIRVVVEVVVLQSEPYTGVAAACESYGARCY